MDGSNNIIESTAANDSWKLTSKSERGEKIIIAMTANALGSDVENSFKSGMSGHISKPIEPEEVYKCLNKWLLEDADI